MQEFKNASQMIVIRPCSDANKAVNGANVKLVEAAIVFSKLNDMKNRPRIILSSHMFSNAP